MATAEKIVKKIGIWFFALVLSVSGWAVVNAHAANDSGLVVEQVYLREILRSYAADPAGFDTENGPQALAELFGATVGLNYYGEGNPASYFAKDISGKYDQEPYVAANLLGSYDVPIHPVNGRAEASPGQTWKIHVYLTGYTAEAVGAVPVYHYVWQDNGSWWAVRDHVPYYRVSYNGAGSGQTRLGWLRTTDVSTGRLTGWAELRTDTAAIANGNTATYVAAEGAAAIFAALDPSGNPLAISDYVQGSGSVGPVLRSKTILRPDGNALGAGEEMQPGVSYRVRLVYRDGLKTAHRDSEASVSAVCSDGRPCGSVTDVVWYGAEEYLPLDSYNPERVEFTVTPGSDCDWCLFQLMGVVGFENGLTPAAFWQNTANQPAPASTPEATAAPKVAATPEGIATPEVAVTPEPTEEPSPEPTATPTPDPNALVTWGDLAMRLWELQGRTDVVGDPTQSDLYLASCWADSIGLVEGWANGGMTADVALSREQMACVLHAYAIHLGRDVSAMDDLSLRPDGAYVSPWAVAAVQWAVGSGVLAPAMDGSIAPGATISRGQLDWMLSLLS